jgi:hypothetical protein
MLSSIGVSKKIKKPIKPRKLENKLNREKKQIKILKKPTSSVRFYKPETEKTKPNLNRKKLEKKPSQTENRAKPV